MQPGRCFRNFGEQTYAILNWRDGQDEADAVILRPLNIEQQQSYRQLSQVGESDESIFQQLFPRPPAPVAPASPNLDRMTKRQLGQLLRRELNGPMPPLWRLSKEDLLKLLHSLQTT
jgi:hypothetical protein